MDRNFENIPSMATHSCEEGGRSLQKRKYDKPQDAWSHDERVRKDEEQTLHSIDPRHYEPQYEPNYNAIPAEPLFYVPSAGMYLPQAPQRPMPFLPGAEMYQRRQIDQSIPSSPNNMHVANTSWAREHTKSTPFDQTYGRIGEPTEQRMSQNRYHPTSERYLQASAPLMGSQNHPVEIESSPEPEPTRKSSKRKRKNNFYAVAAGHVPGIYRTWAEVEPLIKGYSGVKQHGFETEVEARAWLEANQSDPPRQSSFGGNVAIKSETSTITSTRTQHIPDLVQSVSPTRVGTNAFLSSASRNEPIGMNIRMTSEAADFMPLPSTTEGDSAPEISNPIDPEPVLKPEQQKVVDMILEGHNMFYTGSAGCGKSTILKAFVKQLHNRGKQVKIVAPTNLAALNVGGVTTWSFAGWTPDSMKKSLDKLMQAAHGKEVWERFDNTDVLVIDEISMVENLLFERLNHIMKASIGEKHGGGAFGGIQVIVTGDVSLHSRRNELI
jgi:hypothetical protein